MKIFAVILAVTLVGCSGVAACAKTAAGDPADASIERVVGRVSIVNDAGKTLPARTFTFGQIFRPGAVKFDTPIGLAVGDRTLPAQLDAKAFNADGSVRHGLVTVELPNIRGREALAATITKEVAATLPPAGPYAPTPPLRVTLRMRQAGRQPQTMQFDLPALVQSQEQAKRDLWISGPLGQERRYVVDATRSLQLAFDVFLPRNGPSRVDVIFRNDWADVRADDVVNYDVEIALGPETVFTARNVQQHPYTTWHRLIWSDGSEPLRVAPNVADLASAGAIPNYDTRFDASESRAELSEMVRQLRREPLSPGTLTQYMPTSGGRWDIGPLPTWAVLHLLDGDALTSRVLFANADASGSIPWHIRERKTGSALTLDRYPRLWLDSRGADYAPLAQAFDPGGAGWTIDTAHQPSLTYLPYVLTGLRYYQDELAQQAAYDLLSADPDYRGGAAGLLMGDDGQSWEQVRAVAWSLRTIANAAYVLPHGDPMQGYFDAKLKGILAHMARMLVVERKQEAAGELEGWFPGVYRPENAAAPWQQGYLAIVLGWINDMGYPDAGRTLGWMSNFLTGLFTSEDRGFEPQFGTTYVLAVRDADTGTPFGAWAEVAKANELTKGTRASEDDWQFYGLILRGAIVSIHNLKPTPRAEAAYNYITRRLGAGARGGDPTFVIAPRRTIRPTSGER